MPKEERAAFSSLGTSCHSVAEALEAQALGATYLLAGHIFDTSCKPGLPGRGLDFLAQVCAAVPCLFTPLAASRRKPSPGCAGPGPGACFRSSFMTCPDPASYLHTLERSFSHAISP
ncbi:MAG: thiamine phosphate synthase [Evtepia gabavorous]